MAQFFISNVVNELIDDAWTENRDMILPEFELMSSSSLMSDDSDDRGSS